MCMLYDTASHQRLHRCRSRRIRHHSIVMGKLNAEKLCNFPSLDAFIIIGCPRIFERARSFPRPVISPREAEIAWGVREWQATIPLWSPTTTKWAGSSRGASRRVSPRSRRAPSGGWSRAPQPLRRTSSPGHVGPRRCMTQNQGSDRSCL
eukprot:Polyplicarium_translucidae@DN1897_c0_g1_i2.p2